jgi:F0F1-type ATP synthase membrane subunit a
MPEGTIICIMLVFVLSAAVGVVGYCLWLARRYRRIEADMQCIYEGTVHHVVDIIYDNNDWFLRKVRLHIDTYPYVVDKLISEVRAISLR